MKTLRIWIAAVVCLLAFAPVNAQEQGKSQALYTLGYSGGTVLYNTYSLIGALNDGYWKNAWTKEYTLELLDEQKDLMKGLSQNYDDLVASHFWESTADSVVIADMSTAAWKLRGYAVALEDYINNEDSDYYRQAYLDARDAAWEAVEKVIGPEGESTQVKLERHDGFQPTGSH